MRAGVRKAGPLQKTLPIVTPLTAPQTSSIELQLTSKNKQLTSVKLQLTSKNKQLTRVELQLTSVELQLTSVE